MRPSPHAGPNLLTHLRTCKSGGIPSRPADLAGRCTLRRWRGASTLGSLARGGETSGECRFGILECRHHHAVVSGRAIRLAERFGQPRALEIPE